MHTFRQKKEAIGGDRTHVPTLRPETLVHSRLRQNRPGGGIEPPTSASNVDPLCMSVSASDPIATSSGRGDLPCLLRCGDLRLPTSGALPMSYPGKKNAGGSQLPPAGHSLNDSSRLVVSNRSHLTFSRITLTQPRSWLQPACHPKVPGDLSKSLWSVPPT